MNDAPDASRSAALRSNASDALRSDAAAAPRRQFLLERIIEASARNGFLVIVLTVLGIGGGLWALNQTALDAIPDLSDVQVIVYTQWEGRSPDLIEDQITYPISSRFIAAPKVKFVRGESMFGKSFVYVIFQDGTDIYWARSRVMEYLSAVRGMLPEGVNPMIGPDATGVGWVYEYALVDKTGKHNLAELRSFQDWHLRYALESVKGVSEVAVVGGFVKQYQVDLDPNKLLAYGIPISEVVNKIRMSNGDVGGKIFEVGSTEYYVRGRGYIKSVADIEDIPLKSAKGTPVFVKNVGTVHLGSDLRRGVAELNGEGEVVGGIVVMRYGENALRVIDGIKRKLEEIKSSLPEGVEVVATYDRSQLIKRSIATLREKLIEESIVVALVCLVFLWHIRSALVAIITLPIAILLSFLPMFQMQLTSNIMSLGGIAIAIGAMVDSAIIMVENAHKYLEHFRDENGRDPTNAERIEVIINAAKSVGRPLFFALLVITASFIPVFSLEAQEGRLFKPLAFTKTFSMFFAALLGVTLVPVLMIIFVRGRITPEKTNPINRLLIWLYQPFVHFVLRFRWLTILTALAIMAATIYPFNKLGKEFMPPLNEGDILYMPTAVAGISVSEATKILQIQDRMLREFPEVESVFGKAGESETSTDPAPLSMIETVVKLKPPEQWRPGMTWEKLLAEMNEKIKTPGMANIFWMPIQTRTEMLTTGFRSILGIKVFGPDLAKIQDVGVQIEKALSDFPGTRSVFAERTTGGYFLDFTPDRKVAARYGLTVGDVNDIVETAIGGKTIAMTVEGRERYPISVRYARDFREDLDALKRVLVPVPMEGPMSEAPSRGASGGQGMNAPARSGSSAPALTQIPISMLADISYKTGPPSIRNENGQLVGFVFVDITGDDIQGYVNAAAERIKERVQFPPGYYIQWAGQFEYLKSAEERLKVVVPFTLLIIFVLIYMNTKSTVKTFIVLLAVPFSLVGAFWFLYLLHYNMSVAVWVGLIALAGLDAETGVVMLLYLDHAWEKFRDAGRMNTMGDLQAAVIEGAVQRIRPKIMTICAILFGLLPIMWSPTTQSGADVMKRIAAPMIGGVVTSGILELLIYPVIFLMWRRRHLPITTRDSMNVTEAVVSGSGGTPTAPSTPEVSAKRSGGRMVLLGAMILVALGAGGYFAWQKFGPLRTGGPITGTAFATQTVNGLTVTLIHPKGQLIYAENDFLIEFREVGGALVDVGTVTFVLDMNMPGMVMHNSATVKPTRTPGQYRASLKPDMAGDWTAKVEYDGPHGKGSVSFSVAVSAYTSAKEAPAPPAKVGLNGAQRQAAQEIFDIANVISASLAADKLNDFNQAVGRLPAVLPRLQAAFERHSWLPLIQKFAGAVAPSEAKSLEDARKAFYPFTAGVVEFAKTARQQAALFATLKIYKCPMAPKPGQTSFWIQLQGPLRNPFYGAEMLDCGSEVNP
jgi:Cu(I)/Ag(I) efflux system membrane protein CusA/SilA